MANIHIALVGGQTTPVYQGIMYTNPDRVILIHSTQTETEANRINAEIMIECELIKFNPVDLQQISDAVIKLKNGFSTNNHITINVGGGTKPWSIIFYEYFRKEANAQLFYIDQNNLMWDLKTNEKSEVGFDMDVQFRLLGNPLTRFTSFSEYSPEDKQVCVGIRTLRNVNFRDFFNLTKQLYDNPNLNYVSSSLGSFIQRYPADQSYHVEMKGRSGVRSLILSAPHIDSLILNTGWFELEIAELLSGWSKAKEIRLNCVFPSLNETSKNEIDIIIHTGTKLLFVECKTSIFDNTTIDKFASAVKLYGGLGSKALFITDTAMKSKAIEKCHDHGIMHYSLQNNPEGKTHREILFEMLEKELNNLNAK